MTIEALEGLTDEQLFSESNADEDTTEEVVAEPTAEAEPEQPRAEETAEPVAADPLAKAPVDDNAPQVPSWRVREINEERRAAIAERDAAKAERDEFKRLAEQARRPTEQPQAPAQEEPDPLLDPKAYREFIREETRKEILNERRESSLEQAHRTYKGEFEEAYAAAQKQVDPVLKMKMQQSRDPGETLIQWHREQKTRAEVGTDPNAYFDKRLEAFLAEPANQAKMLERIRGGVQPAANGRPAPVSLPPSLTRATNAAADVSADDNDVSDDGLWRHANA